MVFTSYSNDNYQASKNSSWFAALVADALESGSSATMRLFILKIKSHLQHRLEPYFSNVSAKSATTEHHKQNTKFCDS